MSLVILSPWSGDWLPNRFGTPKNRFLFEELERRGVDTLWFYWGGGNYEDGKFVKFIPIPPKRWKWLKPPALRYMAYSRYAANYILDLLNGHGVHAVLSMYWMYFAGRRVSRALGVPHIVKLFGISANPLIVNIKNPLVQIKHFDLLPLRMGADKFVIENDGSNGELSARMFGIPSRDILINIQPVPDRIRKVERKEKNTITVGFAGRLERYKGMDYLIRVMEYFRNDRRVRFLIAGSGSYEKKISSFPNAEVIRLGFDEMHLFYNSIDFLLNPSLYANMTRPTIEAFAYGKPVVAFDLTLSSIVVHDYNGLLAKPFSTEEFIQFTIRLVEDANLRNRLSQGALETAERLPTIRENIRREVDFYMRVGES